MPRRRTADTKGMIVSPHAADTPRLLAPSLLIIDDEDPLRAAVTRWFSRRGWQCAEAATLADAERLLFSSDAAAPDVIVCDLHLPDGNAEGLLARIKRERPDLARRLILATGDVLTDEQESRLTASGCSTLAKPFDLDEIEAVARATHLV